MSKAQKNSQRLEGLASILEFNPAANGVSDDSAAATAMLAQYGYLHVPKGTTLALKNIQLTTGQKVLSDGVLRLPAACSDFDRMFYAAGATGVEIHAAEIDGNASGQSGSIGTHLVYLTGCDNAVIDVDYLHDHYISTSATMPSVDGIRNASCGPVFLQGSIRGRINLGLIVGWGREAIYVLDNSHTEVSLGHAEGTGLTEYSGVQVSGTYNKILKASVNNAGASAIGFDTRYGTASNLVATNTRANQGINLGHPGRPATGSVLNNIEVDGCYLSGIGVQASSQDVSISNFCIRNAGTYGVSFSDGVTAGRITNGTIQGSGRANFNAYVAQVVANNVDSDTLDTKTLTVDLSVGLFQDGETITSATGSAVARRAIQNLTGSQQVLFLSSIVGTFSTTQALTGALGASGTISRVDTPVQYNEAGGGIVLEEARYATGSAGNQVRLADGSAIYTHSVAIVATAGTLHTVTINYFSNVQWASAPLIVASVASASATDGFSVQLLKASSTTSTLTLKFKADVSQTYGISIVGFGRVI